MDKIALGFIAFIAGAATGALVTYICARSSYEKKLVEEMKEFTASRIALEKRRRAARGEAEPEEEIAERVETAKEYEGIADGYCAKEDVEEETEEDYDEEYEEDEDDEEEVPTKEPMTDDDIRAAILLIEEEGWDEKDVAEDYGVTVTGLRLYIKNFRDARRKKRNAPITEDHPVLISIEEFEEQRLEYEKVDLIYYRGDDCILFDETGEQMLEIGLCLGKASNLYTDKEDLDHYIYIRNDMYKKDYRIRCREESSDE